MSDVVFGKPNLPQQITMFKKTYWVGLYNVTLHSIKWYRVNVSEVFLACFYSENEKVQYNVNVMRTE